MHRDGPVGKLHEDDFGRLYNAGGPRSVQAAGAVGPLHQTGRAERTDGVCRAEPELEPVCLVLVERVAVKHLDV